MRVLGFIRCRAVRYKVLVMAPLKTEKDLSHRKEPKRMFGHRKGPLFAIYYAIKHMF